MLYWEVDMVELCGPMPPSPLGISFNLGTWESTAKLSQDDEMTRSQLKYGYPRVFIHDYVRKLFSRMSFEGLLCYAFPTRRIAEECLKYLGMKGSVEVEFFNTIRVYGVHFPPEMEKRCHEFFQLSGENLSPRFAAVCLKEADICQHDTVTYYDKGQYRFYPESNVRFVDFKLCEMGIKKKLRQRIAGYFAADASDVFLFPTGMAAIYNALKLAIKLNGNDASVCLGHPYKDAYRMISAFGPKCHLLKNSADLTELQSLLAKEKLSFVFCEFPSNPLLKSPDLVKLRQLADEHGFLILADVTLANFINLGGLEIADILIISLTKVFSGYSDVMGGCLVLTSQIHHHQLKREMDPLYEDTLFCKDAHALERNSRDMETRAIVMNFNALKMAIFLSKAPPIKVVNYPKFTTPELYSKFRKEGGGYGSVLSIEFHENCHAIAFFNALNLPKGMSIGANFTLVAPFTLLAFPNDEGSAQVHGIGSHLIRISVGTERYPWLESKLKLALKEIK